MSDNYVAIIIQPNGTWKPITIDRARSLKTLQGIVGGYIEAVYSADMMVTFFVNEQGKLEGLPRNTLATDLWQKLNPAATGVDVLCGPAVVTGGADESGRTLSVPDYAIDALARLRQ